MFIFLMIGGLINGDAALNGGSEREDILPFFPIVVHFINDLADERDTQTSHLQFVGRFGIRYMRCGVKGDSIVREG